eukprot:2805594-Pyramimonas_sp.AAC.1
MPSKTSEKKGGRVRARATNSDSLQHLRLTEAEVWLTRIRAPSSRGTTGVRSRGRATSSP